MRTDEIDTLERELAGLTLRAILAGVPTDILDRHFSPSTGEPRVPCGGRGYAELLRTAADDVRAAAVAMGHAREVVESWGPLPVATVLAVGERWLRQSAERSQE